MLHGEGSTRLALRISQNHHQAAAVKHVREISAVMIILVLDTFLLLIDRQPCGIETRKDSKIAKMT